MGSKDFSRRSAISKFSALVFAALFMGAFAGFAVGEPSQNLPSINKIEIRSADTGEEVVILANSPFEHSAFLLSDPQRLVLDIPNATLDVSEPSANENFRFLKAIDSRVIQSDGKELVRIELMLAEVAPYRIETLKSGLKVVLGDLKTGSPRETADAHSMTQSLPKGAEGVTPEASAQPPAPASSGTETSAENVYGLAAPVSYKGKPIFLDLKDADILDIFRLIAEVSEFNVVVDPDVGGRITIRMDNVPWDQALEVILKNQGLGKEIEGNIMRIAKNDKLRMEADLRAQLEAAKRKAEPINTIILYLSYAQIQTMETTLKIFLTERGSIVKDERTNALVIRDIRPVLDHIKDMVKILDIRTRQVSLSAQIVQTTKRFSQAMGIRWGGKFTADAAHGNTTKYNFPNNININGQVSDELYAVNLPGGADLLGFTFGNILDTLKLNIMLTAAESDGLSKTIARPTITTSNNNAATLSSGQQISVPVEDKDGVIKNEWKDIPTSLNITPHITNDDYINMTISMSRDALAQSGDQVIINTNSATTNVLVKDGETLVIGGLTDSTFTSGGSKIPWFHKIPVLGYLFKNNIKSSSFSDVLFFITPQILDEGEQIIRSEDF